MMGNQIWAVEKSIGFNLESEILDGGLLVWIKYALYWQVECDSGGSAEWWQVSKLVYPKSRKVFTGDTVNRVHNI